MTTPRPATERVSPQRAARRIAPWKALVAAVIVFGAAGAAFSGWYLFLRPAPAAVSLGTVAPTATQAAGASAGTSAAGVSASTGSSAAIGGLDGTWTVSAGTGSYPDFSSFVGYRVHETLGTIGANEAVGRTPKVTGSLTLLGSTVTAVDITADMTALQSDENQRDGRLRQQAIQTSTFPTATFKLTSPLTLDAAPVEGQKVTATATGDLTLHGQTKSVQIPIEALLSGGTVTVIGSLPITFADYGIEKPTSQLVLSIEDHGVMELKLTFAKV
jgi:polyisoprenoid-binding protein YceI